MFQPYRALHGEDAGDPALSPYSILRFPDGRLMSDSAPLAYVLEREHTERSIIPADSAIR